MITKYKDLTEAFNAFKLDECPHVTDRIQYRFNQSANSLSGILLDGIPLGRRTGVASLNAGWHSDLYWQNADIHFKLFKFWI